MDTEQFFGETYMTSVALAIGDYNDTSYAVGLSNMEYVFDIMVREGAINCKYEEPSEEEGGPARPDYRSATEQVVYDKMDLLPSTPNQYNDDEEDDAPPLLVSSGSYGYMQLYIRKDICEKFELDSLDDYPCYNDEYLSNIENEAQYHMWIYMDAEDNFPDFFDKNDRYCLTNEDKDKIYIIITSSGRIDRTEEGTSISTIVPKDSDEYRDCLAYLQEVREKRIIEVDKAELVDNFEKAPTAHSSPTSLPRI